MFPAEQSRVETMPRTCTVCVHPQLDEINRLIIGREPLRNIAKRVSLSTAALFRHAKHIPAALARASEAATVARADGLLDQLRELTAEAQRIKQKAEKEGDYRAALAAVRELCRIVELIARLRGELDERVQMNILNVRLDPDTATRVAETYLARRHALESQ